MVSWSLLSAAPASTLVCSRGPENHSFETKWTDSREHIPRADLFRFPGRSPTHSTSEAPVKIAQGGMPWESDAQGKYKYHPGGDPNAEPRDAPSALNVVVVPNVTLPKELHDKYNKWGKDGYP